MVREYNSVVFAQTPLLKSQLEELKRLTGTTSTKDALQAAINHYLTCPLLIGAGVKKGRGREDEHADWWWSPEEEHKRSLGGEKSKKMAVRGSRKSLKKDERAVSPVIGVILMIAITVVIAAVVAAFAYGIIGSVARAPNAALVFENTDLNKTNITLVHHGGDTITNAFTDSGDNWGDMVVKLNGVDVTWATNVTIGGDTDPNFESGEQLRIKVRELQSGDTISVVYRPTGDILQRVKVP